MIGTRRGFLQVEGDETTEAGMLSLSNRGNRKARRCGASHLTDDTNGENDTGNHPGDFSMKITKD